MLKGYRTIIFNTLTLAVTIAGASLQYVDSLGLSSQQAAMAGLTLTLINTVGNLYLRRLTTTPIGRSE